MDRRSFIRSGLVGGAAGIIAPEIVLASAIESKMAGGVYYTKDSPGRWSKKVGGHLPVLDKKKGADGKLELMVTTKHEMKGYEHYIIKHVLLDRNFGFIEEHMFDPTRDKAPVSTFNIDNCKGMIHVLSVCNKHDTWMNTITI